MSYTTIIKNEVVTVNCSKSELSALLSAFFRSSCVIENNTISVITENSNIVRFVYAGIKQLYNSKIEIEEFRSNNFKKKMLYKMIITDKIDLITKDLHISDNGKDIKDIPSNYLVSSDEDVRAYLQGAFLSGGSINDPKTSRYHMEILFNIPSEAVFVQRLLNDFDLNAKLLTRDKGYMVYLKEAEKISDFLKLLRASKAVMYFEDVRILHEQKNLTNRLNNCEQANVDKVIHTALEQVRQIEKIEEVYDEEMLDDKIVEVMEYRKKYRDASLLELSQIISLETGKSITKSGLNHRFRKIKEMYDNIEKNKS